MNAVHLLSLACGVSQMVMGIWLRPSGMALRPVMDEDAA
jgi:hypothetical protein